MSVLLTGIASISTRTKFGDKVLLSASTTESVDPGTTARYKIQMSNDSSDTIDLTNDAFRTLGSGTTSRRETATYTFNSDLIEGQSVTIGGVTVTASGGVLTKEDLALRFSNADTGATTVGNAVVTVSTNLWHASTGTKWAATYDSVNTPASVTATYNTAATNATNLISSTEGSVDYSVAYTEGIATGTGGQSTLLSSAVTTFGTSLTDGENESTLLSNISNIQDKATDFLLALSTQRSKLGALQNQMESSVSNVQELSANLSSARSRIQDTDYASETATLTKGQILQQAATAMLAQANQMPNVILSLLK
jgi:flagellin